MKKPIAFVVAFVMLFCLAGCSNKKNHQKEGYTFTDDTGKTVTVASTDRVAVLLGSFADMWYLAGGSVCAVSDDGWEDFDLPLSDDVINLGSTHNPHKEALLESEPDFVIASSKLSKHLELSETLDAMGISVAYFDVGDFEDYLRVLKIMTDITKKPQNYQKYGTSQQDYINGILNDHKDDPSQTVLVMRASASSIRAKNSEDTMLGEMLLDFGCVNIADSDSMLLDNLSVESIILKNPQKIFFIQTGDDIDSVKKAVEDMFSQNPLWYELDAVKNKNYYFMDKSLYNLKPNDRFGEAYKNLEKILYEE